MRHILLGAVTPLPPSRGVTAPGKLHSKPTLKLIALFIFLSSLFFYGCIDEIKLNLDADQQKLTVSGLIADSLQAYQIKLNYSAVIGVGNDNILTPVSGATVNVLDNEGNVFLFEETAPGIYSKEMQGIPGRSYHLELTTADGKIIQSDPAVLSPAPEIGSIGAEVTQKTTLSPSGRPLTKNTLLLKMNTSVAGFTERPFLRWRAEGEYEFHEAYPGALNIKFCYIKDKVDLNNIKIFDTGELAGEELTGEEFLTTDFNYRFAEMFCFHLFQYSMSEQEYEYLKAVDDIVHIDGSLFDPPPGTVRGNLRNVNDPDEIVLGYFSVSGVSYKREFVNSNSLGFFVEPKCSSLSFRPQYAECRECTDIIGSSLEKPEYWIP